MQLAPDCQFYTLLQFPNLKVASVRSLSVFKYDCMLCQGSNIEIISICYTVAKTKHVVSVTEGK